MGSKRKLDDATTEGSEATIATAPQSLKRHHMDAGDPSRRNDSYYRNLYTSQVDFRELGRQDPAFKAFLRNNSQLDFNDPAAVMQLTKTLLKRDFGLDIEVPDDRLCPPVPNRHNYILWLQKLLDTSSYKPPGGKALGLDIGTGASCIYPLLGTVQRPWNFVATDIDAKSLEYAKGNVTRNGLDTRIRILETNVSAPIIPIDALGVESLDFVMTNPPFYESAAEMGASADAKSRPPSSACTGTTFEMICKGGELGFVRRILDQSLSLRERIQWYTAMFGKLESLNMFVSQLRECGIDNWAVTEFIQGSRTKRWAIGWSYGPMRPAQSVARGIHYQDAKKILPPVTEVEILIQKGSGAIAPIVSRLNETLGALQLLSWEWDKEVPSGVGRAAENVWGRAWRRKQKFGNDNKEGAETDASGKTDSEQCRFGFTIGIHVGRDKTTTNLRWVEGRDQSLFESFTGFLKSALKGV